MKENAIRIGKGIEKTYIDFSSLESIRATSGFHRLYTIHTAATLALGTSVGFHVGGFCDDLGNGGSALAAIFVGYDSLPSDLILCKMDDSFNFLPLEETELEALFHRLNEVNAESEKQQEDYFLRFQVRADFPGRPDELHYESDSVFGFLDDEERDPKFAEPYFDSLIRFEGLDAAKGTLGIRLCQGEAKEEMTLAFGQSKEIAFDYAPEGPSSRRVGTALLTPISLSIEDALYPGRLVFHFQKKRALLTEYDQVKIMSDLKSIRGGDEDDSPLLEGPDGMVYGVFAIAPSQRAIILYRFTQADPDVPTSFLFLSMDKAGEWVSRTKENGLIVETTLSICYLRPQYKA